MTDSMFNKNIQIKILTYLLHFEKKKDIKVNILYSIRRHIILVAAVLQRSFCICSEQSNVDNDL